MNLAADPFLEIVIGQPAPPADLEHLIEVELVYSDHDEGGSQHCEVDDVAVERADILVLQGIVEAVLPAVVEDLEENQSQIEPDDRSQQAARRPPLLGK